MAVGSHLIKSYCRQQKTVALSSAEAELHAMVAASAEVMGIIGLFNDVGVRMEGEVLADSSAALGISNRAGVGKVRHLRIQALWVQEVRSTGRLGYKKVLGTLNPADVLTKHVPGELLDAHLRTLGLELRGGRAETAPSLDMVTAEHVADEVVLINYKRVSFHHDVQVRPIPAAGSQRPTRYARKLQRPWADGDSDEDEERGTDSVDADEGEFEDMPDYEEVDANFEKRKPKEEKKGVRPPCQGPCASRRDRLDKPSAQYWVGKGRDSSSCGRGSLAGSSDCDWESRVRWLVERDLYRVRSKGEHENTGSAVRSSGSSCSSCSVSSTSTTSLPVAAQPDLPFVLCCNRPVVKQGPRSELL